MKNAANVGHRDPDVDGHSRDPVLSDLFAGILESTRATYDFTEGVHPPSLTTDDHRAVFDAIAARDEDAAVRAALGYLDRVLDAVHQAPAREWLASPCTPGPLTGGAAG
ncbi:GntR family transcriptional regulator [Rhodococcus opacus M213]|uniref:GntR family transcriptional regulator n=1 Tax=Rhodococcus opacus M213 TaxID=1129896 RepID=K8X8R2_RHOOP|nr:GntR family transcriptional regulator [Rhodococcus opacus M213]